MHRPSTLRLFGLFARMAVRRFCNRFLFVWQKKAEARRKRKGAGAPVRTATAHRHQRFRPANLLAVLFTAYMMFALGMMMNMSFLRAVDGVARIQEPVPAVEEYGGGKGWGREGIHAEDLTGPGRPKPVYSPERLAMTPLQLLQPATRVAAEQVTALLMFVAGLGTLLFNIGMLSRQLSRPEPSLAWLFEFPVPRPVLFSSKLCEGLFDGASLPLLSLLPGIWIYHSGKTFWPSAGWGLAFGFLMALTVAALRMAAEVLLLQKVSRRRRGTLAGMSMAFGTLLMVVVLYGGNTRGLVGVLLQAAEWLPSWVYHNPFSAGFGNGMELSFTAWLSAAGVTAGVCVGAVFFCSRLTRFGLEPGLETLRGTRDRGKGGRFFRGLVGKEMLMLVRQRTILVQVLLAPVIMVAMMYFQSSGKLAERVFGSDGALASAIYGVCAYMVLIASQVAMNTELRTLWLLLSLPRPIADSLRMKGRIWGATAAVLALVLAVAVLVAERGFLSGLSMRLPFMLAYIVLIADLSVGIRTMGSSIVSETTVHFRQWAAWLPLALSALAGHAVFVGDVWSLCMQLVLLAALDIAVWQKMKAELPWLTEPAEDPPPKLYFMHGQLAACGYFALQFLGTWIARDKGWNDALAIPVVSGLAAAVIAMLTFLLLTRRKVRLLPEHAVPPGTSALFGVAGLAVACLAGVLWLWVLRTSSWASRLMETPPVTDFTASPGTWTGLIVLAVVIAPLSEEFIFRGLLYQGLRRANGVGWSILWSSLLFAVVHPPVGAPAVFVLAAVNAWVMERTGRITPCILIHAGYNAFIIWVQTRG